ncbi:MAG: VCBS repeat-containing protein [bacterium]|nr:VCBS repeat-containing protein [bacterium]
MAWSVAAFVSRIADVCRQAGAIGRSVALLALLPAAVALLLDAGPRAQIHVAPTGDDQQGVGTMASPFLTINHAAAVAAPGATIVLAAGIYGDEQGIVLLGSKDLVLQGAGVGVSVLRPHLTLSVGLVPGDATATALQIHRVGIVLSGDRTVHLRDLTIDAQSITPPSGFLAGMYLRGGVDVVCEHVAIHDCRAAAVGAGLAQAIVVRGDVPTDPTTLVARDLTLTAFGAAGVRALLRAEVELTECRLAGLGAAAGAVDQRGIFVEADAIGSVRLSRIADCGGGDGAAIRCSNHGTGGVIEGNRIAHSAIGIDLQHVPPSIVPGSVRANRVAGVDTTVRVQGVLGLTIAGNSLAPVSRFDAVPWFDDTDAGNAWSGNRYAVAPGTAAVVIPGGSNVDASPLAGISELGDVQRVPTGGAPVAITAADFNGDSIDDFATLDLSVGGCGLSVGLGAGGGYAVSTVAFGSSAVRPVALVVGDFDAMPGRDLVALTAPVPPANSGAAFWVFSNDGLGGMTLLHTETLPGYINPAALATASFNANPFDDLVVLDRGALPLVAGRGDTFLNDGTGTTWFATPLPIAFTAAGVAAAAGDVNGDNKVDLAIAEGSASDGRIHLLLGNGIGFFAAAASSPLTGPVNPTGVTLADADLDGDRDLLATGVGAALPFQRGALWHYDNVAGVLAAPAARAIEFGPGRVITADLDADAFGGGPRSEVLVASPTASAIALLGAYEPTTGFVGGGLCTLVEQPVDIAVVDFDLDDFGDVIVAEPMRGGVAVLRGSPTAQVMTFGRGCPGQSGREPRLTTIGAPGLPRQPNGSLQIGLADGAPLSFAVYAAAITPAPVLQPCSYLLDVGTTFATWIALTDAAGHTEINLPLPASPDVRGLPICLQAGVFDAAATTSAFVGFSLTAGLRLRIGD